jgi:glycosyltransferase involved in cell wall biosynthesis
MKILVVAWYMPPFNTMGALRVGKFCKYLHENGHEVRVVAADGLPYDRTLAVEMPERQIVRVPAVDLGDLPRAAQRLRVALRGRRSAGAGAAPEPVAKAAPAAPADAPGVLRSLLRAARIWYERIAYTPDRQIAWLPFALRGSRALLAGWRPDIVFASAPPFTTLIIGRMLARRLGVPWVAEYRDRFVEDPYSEAGRFRKALERRMEDRWMRGVAGIVTVSEPWAAAYRARFDVPVATVYNGFDPRDFPAEYTRRAGGGAALTIVYTGILYAGRRDPSALFEAMKLCAAEGVDIRAVFYGPDPAMVSGLATRYGVSDRVEVHGWVPYHQSIELQMNADILLLLQWNDPKEQGNVPGKLFEYLAARRPVLGLGLEDGVPARILKERNAGIVVNDPAAIAAQLRRWFAEKQAHGAIPLLPLSVREGVSRNEQFRVLEEFLQKAAAPPR